MQMCPHDSRDRKIRNKATNGSKRRLVIGERKKMGQPNKHHLRSVLTRQPSLPGREGHNFHTRIRDIPIYAFALVIFALAKAHI